MRYFTMALQGQLVSFTQNEYGTISILSQRFSTDGEATSMEYMPQSFSTGVPYRPQQD